MKIVSVVLPLPLREPLYYLAESGEGSLLFKRVLIPLRNRKLTGVVIDEVETEEVADNLKQIIEILDREPLFGKKDIEFYRSVAEYYFTPMGIVMKYSLPGWTRFKSVKVVKLKRRGTLPPEVEEFLLRPKTLKSLRAKFPSVFRRLKVLCDNGVLEVKEFMRGRLKPESLTIEKIDRKGIRLNREQKRALEEIRKSMGKFSTFLLFGPPASGKTEVYIEAVKEVLKSGRNAIVLVPEILLATHLIDRYRMRLGKKVLPFHSSMKEKERAGVLLKTKEGGYVVIGPKSLILAPIPKLGIIIVDEEHDISYKNEGEFPYQARDVAVKKGEIFGLPVVLGTATPSIETWYYAMMGKYRLLLLKRRFVENSRVEVHVVKLSRRKGILSEQLKTDLEFTLKNGKQAILLLNRRGYSSFVICKYCGWIVFCKKCSVSMNYHRKESKLVCHYCGEKKDVPSICERCGQDVIKHAGWGTEKLEEALKEKFPSIKILRIDKDEIENWWTLKEKLRAFEKGEYDILIGTQMVGKGLDMPEVELVGVVLAENAFLFPDYRAGERTFSLLTQVIGRSGRRGEGRAIVQAYNIHHPAIENAVGKDVEKFLDEETERRKERGYPPFTHICLVRVAHRDFSKSKEIAEKIKDNVSEVTSLKGPAPSHIMKLKNLYRWSLLLYNSDRNRIKSAVERIQSMNIKAKIYIDPDPVNFS